MMPSLVAVVPVYNEAATIGTLVEALQPICPVIVVDDASTDGGAARAMAAGAARVIRMPRRAGKGAALRSGFTAALACGAGAVATLDGDGQHDPADLLRLLAATRDAPHALVVGDRLGCAGGDRIPPARLAAIRAADRAIWWLTGARVRDTQCGFRIYPAALLRTLVLREEGFVLETEVIVGAVRAGFPVVGVPVRAIYPPGRASRFHALGDASRIAGFLARVAVGELGRRRLPGMIARRLGLLVAHRA